MSIIGAFTGMSEYIGVSEAEGMTTMTSLEARNGTPWTFALRDLM